MTSPKADYSKFNDFANHVIAGRHEEADKVFDPVFLNIPKRRTTSITLLMDAIMMRNTAQFYYLMDKEGHDLTLTDHYEGQNILMMAWDNPEMMRRILDQFGDKIDLNMADKVGKTVMHYVVAEDAKECLELLLKHGANPYVLGNTKDEIIDYIFENEGFDCAEIVLRNFGTDYTITELEALIERYENEADRLRELEVLYDFKEYLIKKQNATDPAPAEQEEEDGIQANDTAAPEPAANGKKRQAREDDNDDSDTTKPSAKKQKKQHAGPKSKAKKANNPVGDAEDTYYELFKQACLDGHRPLMVAYNKPGFLNRQDNEGDTIFAELVKRGCTQPLLEMIHLEGYDLHLTDADGCNPFMLLASYLGTETALLKKALDAWQDAIDLNDQDIDGYTALAFVIQNDNAQAARMLIERGADPSIAPDEIYANMLELALAERRYKCVPVLLEQKGLNYDVEAYLKRYASNPEVCALLTEHLGKTSA